MLKIELPKDYQYDDLAMLMSVAGQLGIDLTPAVYPLPNQFKVLKGIVTCALCNTVTVQWMKISKYSNGAWMKERDFEETELVEMQDKVDVAQVLTAKVKTCWACKTVFMQKEKEELVDIIIKLYAPILTKQEIWKHINELRGASVQAAARRNKRKELEDKEHD
jgi:hypothetical protein